MGKLLIWTLGVAGLLAGIGVGAARQQWPDGFWTKEKGALVMTLIVVAALAPFVQTSIIELGERSKRKAVEQQQKLETFLTTALILMARNGADWEMTGVQVFLVKRKGVVRREQQIRAAKVRLGPVPSSGVKWTKGKGVIGLCWETRAPQFEDLQKRFAPYRNFTAAQWEGMAPTNRFGLSFDDFQRLKGKYGIVAAVPIIDRADKYRGCVTADMPPGKQVDEDHTKNTLASTAKLVAEVI